MIRELLRIQDTEGLPYLYIKAFYHADVRYPYYHRMEGPGIKEHFILYTESGEGILTVQSEEIHTYAGSLCFLPGNQLTSIKIGSAHWEYYEILLGGEKAPWFYSQFQPKCPYTIPVPAGSRIPGMLAALDSNRDAYTDAPLKQLAFLTSLLCEIIGAQTDDPDSRIPKYLMAIRQDFDENYSHYRSLDMLEKEYKINKYRIAKEFSYYFGTSPINYLTAQRIKNAEILLSTTRLKVNEIGQQVGYENTTHFINSFKKQIGMTPLNYRKSNETAY